MGVKFSAACTLDCTEFPTGMPDTLCCKGGTGSDGLPPFPKHSLMSVPSRDIVFNSVGGDFSVSGSSAHMCHHFGMPGVHRSHAAEVLHITCHMHQPSTADVALDSHDCLLVHISPRIQKATT